MCETLTVESELRQHPLELGQHPPTISNDLLEQLVIEALAATQTHQECQCRYMYLTKTTQRRKINWLAHDIEFMFTTAMVYY